MSKIYNVYSLISLLSEGKIIKLADLSEKLEISKTMVRRYIIELEKLGIYVESVRGRYGGYYLSESYYKIPVLPFSQSDIDILEKIDNNCDIHIIIAKIKKYINLAEERTPTFVDDYAKKCYNDFNRAIKNNQKVFIQYYSVYSNKLGSKDYTERTIIPDELFFFDNKWQVHAYCELRKDIRQFEFERIKNYEIL